MMDGGRREEGGASEECVSHEFSISGLDCRDGARPLRSIYLNRTATSSTEKQNSNNKASNEHEDSFKTDQIHIWFANRT